jgi:hypothetical protein
MFAVWNPGAPGHLMQLILLDLFILIISDEEYKL